LDKTSELYRCVVVREGHACCHCLVENLGDQTVCITGVSEGNCIPTLEDLRLSPLVGLTEVPVNIQIDSTTELIILWDRMGVQQVVEGEIQRVNIRRTTSWF
jgi:hypothetical protein